MVDKAQQIIEANKRSAASVGIGGEGSNTKAQQVVGFNREQAARAGVMFSIGTNADDYAKNLQLSRSTGLPTQTVINEPLEAQRRYQLGLIDFEALNRDVPEIINLLGDEQKAKLAYDDLPSLSKIAVSVKNIFSSAVGGLDQAVGMTLHGTGEQLAIFDRFVHGRTRAVFGDDVANFFEVDNETVKALLPQNILRTAGQRLKDEGNYLTPKGFEQTFITDVSGGLGQLTGQALMLTLPGGAVSSTARGASIAGQANAGLRTAAGTQMLFAQGVSQMSDIVRDDDAPQAAKDIAMLSGGALTAATERFALDKVLGPASDLVKNKIASTVARIGIAGASEGAQEITENIGQVLLRREFTNPNAEIKPDEAIYEGEVGAAVGAIARSFLEAALHVRNRSAINTQRAQQAQQSAQNIQQINETVSESKLLNREAQTFESFIEDVAPDGNVFIDANTLMQSGIAEQVAALSPAIREQLELSFETGGQIAIPVSEYAARIAPSEHAQTMLDMLKTEPDGYSLAEARAYMETSGETLRQEVEQALNEKELDVEFKQSADVVRSIIKDQLDSTGRFEARTNDAYASMLSSFYMVNAAKLGTTPEQLYNQYPVNIQSNIIEGDAYHQSTGIERSYIDTEGLTREQAREKTRNFAEKLKADIEKLGISAYVTHSGSAFGASSYFSGSTPNGYRLPPIRVSNHAKTGREMGWHWDIGKQHSADQLLEYLRELLSLEVSKGLLEIIEDQKQRQEKTRALQNKRLERVINKLNSGEALSNSEKQALNYARKIQARNEELTEIEQKSLSLAVEKYGENEDFNKIPFAAKDEASQVDSKNTLFQDQINDVTQTAQFKNWFIDSKVIDDEGSPLVVYHGSTAQFEAFDRDKANSESDLGSGFYFTNNYDDVSANYEGGGPDYESKVSSLAERIESDEDISYEQAEARARRELGEGATLYEVYLSIQNPVVLGGDQPTYLFGLDEQVESDQPQEKDFSDNDEYIEALDEYNEEVRDSLYLNVSDAVYNAMNGLEGDVDEIIAVITENGLEEEKATDFIARISDNDKVAYIEDENGKAASKEFIRRFFSELGYDGIIDHTVNEKFGTQRQKGSSMNGVDERTTHYIAFEPNQIKNINNKGTFDPNDANMFHQNIRGAFNPESLSIQLLEKSDLSTFLHESGHMFLELQGRFVNQILAQQNITEAEQSIINDMQTTLDWLGVESLDQWQSMSIERQRPYHEQFARGFEAYLYEGKAPSIELQGVFQRFRAWLLQLYKSLTALNVELTDDMRSVFDRMLATNTQIELAQQTRNMFPLFENIQESGMTEPEYLEYQSLAIDASNEAIQELQAKGLRDMQWLHNARGREISRLKAEHKARRKEVQGQMYESVMQLPIYQAWDFLKSKDGGKLSHAALVDLYTENGNQYGLFDWKRLQDQRMVTKEETGLHPDLVAERFGYSSGDELIRKLIAAPRPADMVSDLTDVRMLELYGEVATPEALERAADEAVHNEVRSRMVRTEYNALAKATGQRRMLITVAKDIAQGIVNRQRVRDVRPSQYSNAQAREARNAQQALRSGNVVLAATHKRNELIQNYAAKAAFSAQQEVEQGRRYLNKFNRDTIKGLDADYKDQIDSILERFDLRAATTLRTLDKRQSLIQWVESQREQGIEPDLPPELLNEAYRTSYKNISVEEFRGLVDSIKEIEHLGRLKNRLLTAQRNRDFDAVKKELASTLTENSRGRSADARTPTDSWGRVKHGLKAFFASHIKVSTYARIFDGGKDGGAWFEYLLRPVNAAADTETVMRADATKQLTQILSPVFKLGKLEGKKTYFESVGRSFNRASLFAIALNTGNDGNLQRLLDGEGWTYNQIVPMLESLTKQEWQAVQAIWKHFESYRPQIAAKERRVYGREPNWVEPRSFTVRTKGGEEFSLEGGYYPISYDPKASIRAESFNDAEALKREMQGAYTSATTKRSYTKSRVREVVGRPLLYTLDALYSGVNEVIHDLAWHETLIDLNRLMKSREIDSAIRNIYGPEVKTEIKEWLADIAQGEIAATRTAEKALAALRRNVSVTAMGYNLVTAAIQPIGITQSVVRVGGKWIGKGLKVFASNPRQAINTTNEKSAFMRLRAQTRFRELNELKNRVRGKSSAITLMQESAFVLMLRTQQLVDVPTWHGAYEKAIFEGNSESRSIAIADQAVLDSQGSGMMKDLSGVERIGWAKIFTVFYTFFNTTLNLTYGQTATHTNKVKLAADYLMLLTVPAVMDALLREIISFSDDDDDKDAEYWVKKLAGAEIDYMTNLFVGLREITGAFKTVTGTNEFKESYKGPSGLKPFQDVYSLATQINQAEFDEALVKSAINVLGDVVGLPSTQINRAISGGKALAEGKTANAASIVFGFKSTSK